MEVPGAIMTRKFQESKLATVAWRRIPQCQPRTRLRFRAGFPIMEQC